MSVFRLVTAAGLLLAAFAAGRRSRRAEEITRGPLPRGLASRELAVAIAVAFGLTAWLVRDAAPPDRPSAPDGGLVLFTGAEPGQIRPKVDARFELDREVFPGISIMRATLRFEGVRAGTRWTLVASGQYVIPSEAQAEAFCFAPPAVVGPRLTCPGSPDFTIIRSRAVGVVSGGYIRRLVDYDGYQSERSSFVTGLVARPYARGTPTPEVTFEFPLVTPRTQRGGGDTYGVLAPVVATNQADFGAGVDRLRPLSAPDGTLVDSTTGEPMYEVEVADVRLTVDRTLGFETVQSADPPTVSPSSLEWRDEGVTEGPVSYVLHDAAWAAAVTRRTFVAGVTGGLGASFLVLLLERRVRRRRLS